MMLRWLRFTENGLFAICGVLLITAPAPVFGQPSGGRLPSIVDESISPWDQPGDPWARRLPPVPLASTVDLPMTSGAGSYHGWEPGISLGHHATPVAPMRVAWAFDDSATDDAAPSGQGGEAASPASGNQQEGDGRIGPRPPEEINRLALRGTSLLLKPGMFQYDFTTLYVRQEQRAIGILPGGIPVLERVRNRTIVAPMSLRYGWKENLELFATVPFGVSMFEYDNPVLNVTDQTGVLGDITIGFARQLPKWEKWPNWTVTFNVTAPTGAEQGTLDNQASLGNGVWRLGGMINLVESVDPFVFFGGLGYDYPFAKDVQGLTFQFGDAVNMYFGAGLAMTDDISLSAQVNASFQDVTKIEGIPIQNTDIEPVTLRIGLVRRLTKDSRVQPFVAWGLTNDASDYSIGIRFTHDRQSSNDP